MFSAKANKKKRKKSATRSAPKEGASKEGALVQMRDLLEELAGKDDNSALHQVMMAVLLQAEKALESQAAEIHFLRKQLFGRRSEKLSPNQLSLFGEMLSSVVAASEGDDATEKPAVPKKPAKKRTSYERRPLVPTQTVTITVPEDERACPECGKERCTLGHKRTLMIEYTPPKMEVIEILRETVVCRPCDGNIALAPASEQAGLIEGARPGPQLLAALVINKVVDGLPLNRTQKIFTRSGLDIAVQTLNLWESFAYQLVEPVTERLRQMVLECDTINLDDTGLRVRDKALKGKTHRGHVWVFVGRKYDPGGDLTKTKETVFYAYAPTWHAKYPEEILKACKAVLQGDAYRGYERIADPNVGDGLGKLLAGCCMHARRPFVQALELKDPSSVFFVECFQKLYAIEAQARKAGLTADERLALRQAESVPLMKSMQKRAEELQLLPITKPMSQGVTYLLNQWDKLMVPFELDGRVEIDNGVAERYLRRVASGRKSWLFAGSERGAERFAALLSLVASAEAAGIDPGSYIADILPQVQTTLTSRLDELLPHAWRAAGEEEAAQDLATA